MSIGSLKFAANDYIDWLIFQVFFSDPLWVNHGTFLETGGSNGVHASNTLFFERTLNWTGVLIEPTICAACEIPFNRRAVVMHAALAPANGGQGFFDSSGMANFCVSNNCQPPPWDPVPSAPLQQLMNKAGFSSVSLLSIDVEDFGETVVQGLTWEKEFSPHVIIAECRNDDAGCVRIFEKAGYFALPAGVGLVSDVLAWKNDINCEHQL